MLGFLYANKAIPSLDCQKTRDMVRTDISENKNIDTEAIKKTMNTYVEKSNIAAKNISY